MLFIGTMLHPVGKSLDSFCGIVGIQVEQSFGIANAIHYRFVATLVLHGVQLADSRGRITGSFDVNQVEASRYLYRKGRSCAYHFAETPLCFSIVPCFPL